MNSRKGNPGTRPMRPSLGGRPTPGRASALLLILCCLPLGGCITRLFGGGGEPTVAGEKGSITLSKLERIIFNFADRDVTLISDACEHIKRETATAEERRHAQRLKLANGTAVYDIVTSPNSLGHLIDLYVMIHLQHLVLVEEGNAGKLFGEKGAPRITSVLEQLKTEIDQLADLSMKTKRKAHLDTMIQEWRRRNPDVEFVSGFRFGNLPEVSGKSILETLPSFFDVLNPLDDTSRTVEETRHLAERAFYFSKRLPKLLDWQTDSALEEMLAKPEVHQVLEDATLTSGAIDRFSKVIERVPDVVAAERKEFLAAWDARQAEAVSTLRELRATLAEGKEFAAQVAGAGQALELTFVALQKVVEPLTEGPAAEGSKPFDIADYTAAAAEIGRMARDANSLLGSPEWAKRQEDVSRLAAEAVSYAERGTRRALGDLARRMVQVLLAFFGLLILYRVVVRLIEGKRIVPGPAPMAPKAGPEPREVLIPAVPSLRRR